MRRYVQYVSDVGDDYSKITRYIELSLSELKRIKKRIESELSYTEWGYNEFCRQSDRCWENPDGPEKYSMFSDCMGKAADKMEVLQKIVENIDVLEKLFNNLKEIGVISDNFILV